MMKVVLDCECGQVQTEALTPDEEAARAAIEAAAAQLAAQEDARAADQAEALTQLKDAAATGGTVDAALMVRLLGIA